MTNGWWGGKAGQDTLRRKVTRVKGGSPRGGPVEVVKRRVMRADGGGHRGGQAGALYKTTER